jgi:hypothetical protein
VQSYSVSWEIELDAETPQDAAREAWRIMRLTDSSANCFTVCDDQGNVTRIDLQAEKEG